MGLKLFCHPEYMTPDTRQYFEELGYEVELTTDCPRNQYYLINMDLFEINPTAKLEIIPYFNDEVLLEIKLVTYGKMLQKPNPVGKFTEIKDV